MKDGALSESALPQRVVVIGTTGSGKSTLGKRLATLLGASYVELDALHWEPNWIEATAEVFRARVAEGIAGRRWVVDGNYTGKLGYMTYEAADTVLWLDYSFPRVFSRLFVRTMRRRIRREQLWNGNVERLRSHFFTKDSLFLWAVKSHWRHRRDYAARFEQQDFAHLRIVRLRTPADTENYVRHIAEKAAATNVAAVATNQD
jgi:adenylate kinase family enzyme